MRVHSQGLCQPDLFRCKHAARRKVRNRRFAARRPGNDERRTTLAVLTRTPCVGDGDVSALGGEVRAQQAPLQDVKREQVVELELRRGERASVLEHAAHLPRPSPVAISNRGDARQVANAVAPEEAPRGAEVQLVATVEANSERHGLTNGMTVALERSQRMNLAWQSHDGETIRRGVDLPEDDVGRRDAVFALCRADQVVSRAGDARPRPPGRIRMSIQDDGAGNRAAREQVAEDGRHGSAAGARAPDGVVVGMNDANGADRPQFLAQDGRVAGARTHLGKRNARARANGSA